MKIYVCSVCGRQVQDGKQGEHRRACDLVREAVAKAEAEQESRVRKFAGYESVEVEYF